MKFRIRPIGFAAVLLASACTTSQGSGLPSQQAVPDVTSSPRSADPKAAVRSSYTEYWRVEHAVMQLPESEWVSAMSAVAADPQLTRVVEGLRLLRFQSVTLYGSVTPRVSTVEVTGERATLRDCQDASKAGQADAKTGQPKNVGVPRNPVEATLVRGADGAWRVTGVSYPGGTC